MSLFLDNDLLAKLASWNLLDDGIAACGFAVADVRILPTTKFWLRLEQEKCKYTRDVKVRLRAFLGMVKECAGGADAADDVLPEVDDVDPSDAILVVQAARSAGSMLVTGDKRCIRAVATAAAFTRFTKLLAGRVLCLEQVLLRTIDRLTFDEVKRRIVESNQLSLDTAVRAAFGSGMQADVRNACWNLEQRVKRLATDAAGMLAAQQYRFEDLDDGTEAQLGKTS